jgi:hypothetical protein
VGGKETGFFYNKGNGVGLLAWESFQIIPWQHRPRVSKFWVMLARELICGFFRDYVSTNYGKMIKIS